MSWRSTIARRIAAIVRSDEYQTLKEPKDRRRLLGKLYPYGSRSMLPYKVWNEEANGAVFGTKHPRKRAEEAQEQDRGGLFSSEPEVNP